MDFSKKPKINKYYNRSYKHLFIFWNIFMLFSFLLDEVPAANILAIFPIAAKSHFYYDKAVTDSLHEAGHNITLITPFADQLKPANNYTYIDSKNDSFVHVNKSPLDQYIEVTLDQAFYLLTKTTEKHCHNIMHLKEVQDILNSTTKQFDVMFVEVIIMFECYLFIAEKLNIPVIALRTLRCSGYGNYGFDEFYNPSYIPNIFVPYGSKMNFYEKLWNIWHLYQLKKCDYIYTAPAIENFRKMYFNDLEQRDRQVSLVFQNNHFSFFTMPNFPRTIEIAGIHIPKEKPLPKNFQSFLDEAEHGAILFTLGSIVRSSSMTPQMINIFKDCFAEIPQRVIWKYEEKLDDLPNNIMIAEWVPQRDILAHKNVKAFVSHCGPSGVYETIYSGVPVIAIPFFADGKSSAAILKELEVSVFLDLSSLTKEDFRNALYAVINDTKYHDNMKKLSTIFKDRPMTPQQSVVYWTEYVIRHKGAPHIRSSIVNMPVYQYLLLDVVTVAIIIILIILCISYYIISKIILTIKRKFTLFYHNDREKKDE